MNQQRDFAAPFTGCEQLNKSLVGNPPPSSLSTWGLWVERRTSKGSIEAARVLGALVRAAKGNVMSTSLEVLGLLENKVKQKRITGKMRGAVWAPRLERNGLLPQIEEKFLVRDKAIFLHYKFMANTY